MQSPCWHMQSDAYTMAASLSYTNVAEGMRMPLSIVDDAEEEERHVEPVEFVAEHFPVGSLPGKDDTVNVGNDIPLRSRAFLFEL